MSCEAFNARGSSLDFIFATEPSSGTKGLCVHIHLVSLDSQSTLDLLNALDAPHALSVEVISHLFGLVALLVEARVLSLLALLRLGDDVFEDLGLLGQVSSDIVGLGLRDFSNGRLL